MVITGLIEELVQELGRRLWANKRRGKRTYYDLERFNDH